MDSIQTKKNFNKTLKSIAVPIALQNLMLALVGASDALMLGIWTCLKWYLGVVWLIVLLVFLIPKLKVIHNKNYKTTLSYDKVLSIKLN